MFNIYIPSRSRPVINNKKKEKHMAKTKMIVKEDQILVDVEMIFKEIEAAGGDWKKVWQEFKAYLKDVKSEEK